MQDAIASLLQRYGLTAAHTRLIARLDCDVYRIVPGKHTRRGADLSLRIYPHRKHELAPIQAELDWLRALAAQGLHVPTPLADRKGGFVQRWQPDAAIAPRHAVLLTWLGGRMHDQGLTPERLRRIGMLTARLHACAAALNVRRLIATSRLAYAADLPAWADNGRPSASKLSPAHRVLARDAARQLIGELASFDRDTSSWGFVHADLHHWNIVFVRDVAGAIDFSDCGWGHHAFDLATTLQHLKHPLVGHHDHRAHYVQLRASLLEGYAQVRSLPRDVERQLDVYIAARQFETLDWMLDDWPSLEHRAWGPGFLDNSQRVLRDYLATRQC